MSATPQNYGNHARMVPLFHYVTFSILVIHLVWSGRVFFRDMSLATGEAFLFALGVILVAWFARAFPLGVQDRVIRLEEQTRMARLLPDDLKARIPDFGTGQLIGLRFASDEELPGLARRVLDEGITDRKAIKQAVKNWRADHQRI
jgi:hypothetical protein